MRSDRHLFEVSNQDIQRQLDIVKNLDTPAFQLHYFSSEIDKWKSPSTIYSSSVDSLDLGDTLHPRYVFVQSPSNNASEKLAELAFIRWRTYARHKIEKRKWNAMQGHRIKKILFQHWVRHTHANLLVVRFKGALSLRIWRRWAQQQQKAARFFESHPPALSIAICVRRKQCFYQWRRASLWCKQSRHLLAVFASSKAQAIRHRLWLNLRLNVFIARSCRKCAFATLTAWVRFTEYKMDERDRFSTSIKRVALYIQRRGLNCWKATLCAKNEERHRCALVTLFISRKTYFLRWLSSFHTHQSISRFSIGLQQRSMHRHFKQWRIFTITVFRGRLHSEEKLLAVRNECWNAWKIYCVHSSKIFRANELLNNFYARRSCSVLRSWLESRKPIRRWMERRERRDRSRWWNLGWKCFYDQLLVRKRVMLRLLKKRGLRCWKAYFTAREKSLRKIRWIQQKIAQAILFALLVRWQLFRCRQQRLRRSNQLLYQYFQNLLRRRGIQRLCQATQSISQEERRLHEFRRSYRAICKHKVLSSWRLWAHSRLFDRLRMESLQRHYEFCMTKQFVSQWSRCLSKKRQIQRVFRQIGHNRLQKWLWKWRIRVHQRVTSIRKRYEHKIRRLEIVFKLWKSVISHQHSKCALQSHIRALVTEKRLQSALSRWKESRYDVVYDQVYRNQTRRLLCAGWDRWTRQYAYCVEGVQTERKRRILQKWHCWSHVHAAFRRKQQISIQKMRKYPKSSVFYRQWSRWRFRTQCLRKQRRFQNRVRIRSLELIFKNWRFLHRFPQMWHHWRCESHHRAVSNRILEAGSLELWYRRWKVHFKSVRAPRFHHNTKMKKKMLLLWWKWTLRRLQERLIQPQVSVSAMLENRSTRYLGLFQRRNVLRVSLEGSAATEAIHVYPQESLKQKKHLRRQILIPHHRKHQKLIVRSRAPASVSKELFQGIRHLEKADKQAKLVNKETASQAVHPAVKKDSLHEIQPPFNKNALDSQMLSQSNQDQPSAGKNAEISLETLAACELYDETPQKPKKQKSSVKSMTRVHSESISLAEIIGVTDASIASKQRSNGGMRRPTSQLTIKQPLSSEEKAIRFRIYSKHEILFLYTNRVFMYQAEDKATSCWVSCGLRAIAFEALRDLGLFCSKMFLPNFQKLIAGELEHLEAQGSTSKSRVFQTLERILSHATLKSQGYRLYLRSIVEDPKEPLDWYLSQPLPDMKKEAIDTASWVINPLPSLFISAFEKFEMCIQRYWTVFGVFFSWRPKDERIPKEGSKLQIPHSRFLLLLQHLNIVPQLFGRREVETFMDQSCSSRAHLESNKTLCHPKALYFSEFIETLIRCAWTLEWSTGISSDEENDGTIQVVKFVMLIFAMEGSGSILRLQAEDVDVVMEYFQRKRASARRKKSIAFRRVLHDSSSRTAGKHSENCERVGKDSNRKSVLQYGRELKPKREGSDQLIPESPSSDDKQSSWQCASVDIFNDQPPRRAIMNAQGEKDPFLRDILTSFGEIEAQLARCGSRKDQEASNDIVNWSLKE